MDKEQTTDKLYGALAGLFLAYGISTEEGSGKIIIELLKEVEKQCQSKEQKCEELKKLLENSELCKFIISACELNFPIIEKYNKALEEIEEVWKRDDTGDYDFIKFKILNIISKAKM